ncbi:hypothetical protein SAMN05216540_12911 [Butyrivibrio sp. M55]|nr:hypothetical protein SAMN05216540_12911 [Butyrivibrio sp. M55]
MSTILFRYPHREDEYIIITDKKMDSPMDCPV